MRHSAYLLVASLLWAPCATGDQPEPDKALLQQAIGLHQQATKVQDKAKAKALWEQAVTTFGKLTREHPGSKLWGLAQFNNGLLLARFLQRPADAVKAFEALIANKAVDDRDPTGNLMSPFRNYRYRSWLQILDCRVKLKQPGRALAAGLSARDAYVTHCGTCYRGMMTGVRKRLTAVCRSLLLEGEGKAVTAEDKAALDQAVSAGLSQSGKTPPDAPIFLLQMGRHYLQHKQQGHARTLLTLLKTEFASSQQAIAAGKLLD